MTPAEPKEKAPKTLQHIAIIMDGNGRWATSRGLPRLAGHQAGTENLRRIIRGCVDLSIPYLTVYAFSTENWDRPQDEVQGIMQIIEDVMDREFEGLNQEGVRLKHIGQLDRLDPALRDKVIRAVESTKNNKRLTLTIAFNYGGRDEIVCAIQRMIADGLQPNEINDEVVNRYLFTTGTPDPDLIVRTSGEMRISNFLLWQSAYAELYVTPTYWPDFDEGELGKAIQAYEKRERRFGGLANGCAESNAAENE
jgi:undecaprenyl diphosphate synthase